MTMKESLNNKILFNEAGIAGLPLGAISIISSLINGPLTGADFTGVGVISFLLWFAKFFGCIWVMKYFMLRLADRYDNVDHKVTMKLGVYAALLSALIYSGYTFADIEFFRPDYYQAQFDTAMQNMSSMLDSNTTTIMENMIDNFGQITFFINFIYCSVYGIILSAILSRSKADRDPFADTNTPDEQ